MAVLDWLQQLLGGPQPQGDLARIVDRPYSGDQPYQQPAPLTPPPESHTPDEAIDAWYGLTGIPDIQKGYQTYQQGGDPLAAFGQAGSGALNAATLAFPALKALPGFVRTVGPLLGDEIGAIGDVGRIRAFHGSPHSFDRFDLSKIGTGEGAQAYGHGLYFAENPQVARDYRENLAQRPTGVSDPMHDVARYWWGEAKGDPQEAARLYREYATAGGDPRFADYNKEFAAYLEKPPGHMYEVDINAKPEDFLNWDQPFGQQSPTVQGAVEKLFAGNPEIQSALPQATGESIIRRLMPMSGYGRGGPEVRPDVISQTLGEAGIPGTRYADQGSRIDPVAIQRKIAMYQDYLREPSLDPVHRADWTNRIAELQAELVKPQTSNYAIWTPEIITIMRRYGLLPPLATGGLLAAQPGEAATSTGSGQALP